MPAILSPLFTLVNRNASNGISSLSTATNGTTKALQVVCAWPVSGQYGVGLRLLYYVLVAACVLARKAEWLRDACLAAALLLPAVASLHGIVLAAIHNNDAVDMDVFGAFQLCSIGILAAPVTVRLSKTYFYDPGRNTIFLWTALLLAGLLSLTVEFYRITTSDCLDDSGNPITINAFSYGTTSCGLVCTPEEGPHSPMRGGSTDNIYVIPAPDVITFGTGMLLAAACCIPAILSLIFMWNKILKINWKSRFGNQDEGESKRINQPIDGTNGATIGEVNRFNFEIRKYLRAVEAPLFGGAVLILLIFGERNFWSAPVNYQVEPMASVGQWSPIVATVLAALGSLHLLARKEEMHPDSLRHCNCLHHQWGGDRHSVRSRDGRNEYRGVSASPRHSNELMSTASRPAMAQYNPLNRSRTQGTDAGNRRIVAKKLSAFSDYFVTPSYKRFADTEFKAGKASDFPEIPGEDYRNTALSQIRKQYNTPSRAGSIYSGRDGEAGPASPQSPTHQNSFELHEHALAKRRDTLEVPSPVHQRHTHSQDKMATSAVAKIVTPPEGHSSPAIVVSSDTDLSSPVQTLFK